MANGNTDWLTHSPSSVVGAVEYDGNIQIGVTLFYRCDICKKCQKMKVKTDELQTRVNPGASELQESHGYRWKAQTLYILKLLVARSTGAFPKIGMGLWCDI